MPGDGGRILGRAARLSHPAVRRELVLRITPPHLLALTAVLGAGDVGALLTEGAVPVWPLWFSRSGRWRTTARSARCFADGG
ncbi:hypothetical protein ABTX80_04325 [Streptomyces erythrochromogenes]|uniref:hypothetical protein n=1 Tax=Streptomyces erythrochromogenes TaxID=285574 RepID=UPI00332FAEB1